MYSQNYGPSFQLEGLNEALKGLELAERGINTGVNKSLTMGGDVMKEFIEANTPVGSGDKAHGHARDNVTRSNVRTDGGTSYKHILVGYNQNVYWYMWFLEEGTYSKGNPKGISPRHMVKKAFNQSQYQVPDVMAMQLEEVIRGL